MIEVESLSKSYFVHHKEPGLKESIKSLFYRKKIEKKALNNVNFSINEGEIVGLVGSNGAGKTTLAKILSGIIYPTEGHVKVLGYEPHRRNKDYLKQMSLIMGQKAQLWWDLPALDSFLLLKEIYRIEDTSYHEKINELSKILDVHHLLSTQVRRLSLGERMKVEIIASLLHQPKVIFLDEPTIGLDLNAQKSIRDFLKSYRKEYSPIMILTSHYMEDIEELCDRIIILQKGKIVYDGDKQAIYDNYSKDEILKIQFQLKNDYKRALNDAILQVFICGQKESDFQIFFKTISVDKSKIISHLFNHYQVKDINLMQTDLGDIIAKLMTDKY